MNRNTGFGFVAGTIFGAVFIAIGAYFMRLCQ